MARMTPNGVTIAVIASLMLGSFVSEADDLQALKEAAGRYVIAIKAVLGIPEAADCSEITGKACEYAAAKVAYYKAARQAMPALLQLAKGEKTDDRFGQDLIELFRGSGEEDDEQATVMLGSKLRGCDHSSQHCQEREAVEYAEKIAEQFLKDFGQLAGV
jgi:hypothetical protein